MTSDSTAFIDRFALTRVDRDIFTGYCHSGSPLRAFGGQVAAQALVAAAKTIDDPDRNVHSLHGYFLRAGRTTDPIVYLVERPRDGRSFSTRLVRAVQYGKTIFTMSASFSVPEPGPEHQLAMPDVPGPDHHESLLLPVGAVDARFRDLGYPNERMIDVRTVDQATTDLATRGTAQRMTWFRASVQLPDDHASHVCALTYFSDITLPGTTLVPLDSIERVEVDLTSLDHAMWFHGDFRADEWVLFIQDSHVARNARALARGQFYRSDGVLIATAVQEVLIRPKQD